MSNDAIHIPEAENGDGFPSRLMGLHAQVLDRLGLALCSDELPTGTVVRIEELEERYDVSRSVIREALSVLASMGMISSRRRVGVKVMPQSEWNLYDPQLIRWRLASPGRIAQLRSLTELRTAVEPEAARLAAIRAPLTGASELMGLAGKLWAAGMTGDRERFLELDIQFHRLVLTNSGNEMFGKLHTLVEEVLTGRTHYGLMPTHPHVEALQFHVDVASAIQRGNADDAQASMLRIMQRTFLEMSSIWEHGDADAVGGSSGPTIKGGKPSPARAAEVADAQGGAVGDGDPGVDTPLGPRDALGPV